MRSLGSKRRWPVLVPLMLVPLMMVLALILVAGGCTGAVGPTGPAGPPGTSTGNLSGVVTNSTTGASLGGVNVVIDPTVQGVSATTDDRGAYSVTLPVGIYSVTFRRGGFEALTQSASVIAGQTISKNVTLKPLSPVAVNAGQAQTATPGATVSLKATAEPLDGSTITSYEWTQISGPRATLENTSTDTLRATLPGADAYTDQLMRSMEILDRFMVQPINPHSLEAAETATFRVRVTTSSGNYTGNVNVTVGLPYIVTTGLSNVAVGEPVLLNGANQTEYRWALSPPASSNATLLNGNIRNPSFTPDVPGKYTISENRSGATLDVYAGTWAGAISGQGSDKRPASDGCTACHNGNVAPDKFTAWRQSGHAEIFTQNLNTNASYGEGCFTCHAVGFNKSVSNGGFDDVTDYASFLNSGILGKPNPNNWTNMLNSYPRAASLANIQCENCHGPNNSTLHANNQIDAARVSIAADVCGSCHGEPARHGRFQQWELSGHSNFELALEEATVESRGATAGHCGRCHSGQGFLTWIKQEDLTKVIQGKAGNATVDELRAIGLTRNTVQPQTCATCHDPHNPGTVSGEPTNATVRIQDVTKKLPAGFQASEVGKGALCITCHNTRNGPHNDLFPTNLPTSYSAPHTAAQGDVLLGQSAYLVDVEHRSPHASIRDTCVTCHMEKTPPPAEFSYQQSGTNHSFKASLSICASCHSDAFNGEAFQSSAEVKLHELEESMASYLLGKIGSQVTIKDYTPHSSGGKFYDIRSDALAVSKDNIASLVPVEPHGQQGFLFKFKNPVTFTYSPAGESPHSMSLTEAEVQLGDVSMDGRAVIPVTDVLVKVGWNYFLIHGDGSKGVHNPEFVDDILHASIRALR